MMHVGGYHEYRGGCSVPWGEKSIVKNPPTVLMISPTVLNTPHGTEHPHGTAHTLYRVVLVDSNE